MKDQNVAAPSPARPSILLSDRAQRWMMLLVTTLAIVTAAYFAQEFLKPIFFGVVLGAVVAPVADRLDRIGIPRVITASVLVVLVLGILILTLILIEPLITSLAAQWPKIRFEIQSWIFALSDLLRGIENISEEIEDTVGGDGQANPTTDIPSVMDAVWMAPGIGAKFFIFVGTLFFFVLTRARLYVMGKRYRRALFEAERVVSRYFALVTLINLGLGTATGIVLLLIGVPGALLWGLAAGVLNFILYLGPLLITASLLVVGLIEFTGPMVLAPAAAFLCLNLVEAQFVTPTIVGQRLDMNPLGVFLAVTFGLWLWGPVGAIVALPIAIWIGVLLGKTIALGDDEATA